MELGVGGCGGDFTCSVFVRRFVSWISFLLSFLRLFLFFFSSVTFGWSRES